MRAPTPCCSSVVHGLNLRAGDDIISSTFFSFFTLMRADTIIISSAHSYAAGLVVMVAVFSVASPTQTAKEYSDLKALISGNDMCQLVHWYTDRPCVPASNHFSSPFFSLWKFECCSPTQDENECSNLRGSAFLHWCAPSCSTVGICTAVANWSTGPWFKPLQPNLQSANLSPTTPPLTHFYRLIAPFLFQTPTS